VKLVIKKGTTSKRVAIFIQNSSVTTGAGLTGLVFNSASLSWYYWREDEGNANATVVTLATATRGTFASGGFVEKDATNMPGFYEIGIPDAALATGANWVCMILKGATNMAPLTLEIQLVNYDPNDSVRLGLTALPNAAADAAGGLPISDAGGLDLDARLDAAVSSRLAPTVAGRTLDVSAAGEAGLDWANIGSPTTAQGLTGTTISTSQVVASVTGAVGSVTGAVGSVAAGGITTASFAAGAIDAAAIAANAIGASELAQDACQEIADELLNRNIAGGGSGGARIVRDAVRALRNRVAIAAGTATVYAEDDATPAWTAAVTTAAGNPVSEIDPA